MGRPAEKLATYQDVLDAPTNMVAELVWGTLHLSPRPATPHALATSALGYELGPPFHRGRGGPGGWLIIDEPELHLCDDILVPDLAGWKRERLPALPRAPYVKLAPDWICEALSPSTERFDRTKKMAIYAREKVAHAWLLNAEQRLLEVYRRSGSSWLRVEAFEGDVQVRAEPFEAIEVDLSVLWGDVVASSAQ